MGFFHFIAKARRSLPVGESIGVSILFSILLYRDSPSRMATSVDTKLLKKTKFPPEFSQKVDMTKVNVEVMKK